MSTTAMNSLTSVYDPAKQVINVVGIGLWSEDVIKCHFASLVDILSNVRATKIPVRVLSDLREAAVQAPEIAQRIAAFTAQAYRPGDRIAILVASSLVKMQMRRSVNNQDTMAFLSPSAAQTWLFAYDAVAARYG